MKYTLRLTGDQSQQLKEFLFRDENESAMLALCGFDDNKDESLILIHELFPIPDEICERFPDYISWPTEYSDQFLKQAIKENLTIIKIHCHPSDYKKFSTLDDKSDKRLFDYYNSFFDDGRPTASMVMVPDGYIFGRVITPTGEFIDIDKISVIGEQQKFYYSSSSIKLLPEYMQRNQQTFGEYTTRLLSQLKVGIVGCSGLGSPTIMALARSGIGELVLVDNKKIGPEHINRMIGASIKDIGKYKVDFFKEKLKEYGLDVKVTALKEDITESLDALEVLSFCDHIFCCTDCYLPRDVINRLTTYYIIGYTDLAIGLNADGKGGIDSIVGWVRHLLPGGSSLFTRGMYDARDLESESLMKENPAEFKRRQEQKYIKGAKEKSPPVISLNATIASLGVTDFLHRIHPFKYREALGFCLDFCENKIDIEDEYPRCTSLISKVGIGRTNPFLNLIGIQKKKAA